MKGKIATAVLGLCVAGATLTASPAAATATKCAHADQNANPATCLYVEGNGNVVDRIRVGANLDPGMGVTGHWYVWSTDGRLSYETPQGSLYGRQCALCGAKMNWIWEDPFNKAIGMWFADGVEVCAQLHKHPGNQGRGITCATVHA